MQNSLPAQVISGLAQERCKCSIEYFEVVAFDTVSSTVITKTLGLVEVRDHTWCRTHTFGVLTLHAWLVPRKHRTCKISLL